MAKSTGCLTLLSFCTGIVRNDSTVVRPFATTSLEGVAKGSEKKGTTKSTKKSFSFAVKEDCHGGTRRREKSFSSVSA